MLVRKLEHLGRLGVPHEPFHGIVLHVSVSAEDLNGVSGSDAKSIGVGLGYKMGKNVLKAQYYTVDNTSASPSSGSTDASTAALGWDYNMSKRTTAYIAYAVTSNDSSASNTVDGSGHGGEIGAATGKDPSALSLGMIHKF